MNSVYEKILLLPSYVFWPLLLVVWIVGVLLISAIPFSPVMAVLSMAWGFVLGWYIVCPRIFDHRRCDHD